MPKRQVLHKLIFIQFELALVAINIMPQSPWNAARPAVINTLRVTAVAIVVIQFAAGALVAGEPVESAPQQAPADAVDAIVALDRLRDGNRRFVAGTPKHPHETTKWRQSLEHGQHPFAVVLGCSDSRVPPELVFDQGLGDLFVIRVAGNVVDTEIAASIEYAVDHLKTELIVLMGHTHCGAVTATLDHLSDVGEEPAEVVSLLSQIEPAVIGIAADAPREHRIAQAVRQHVEFGVRRLSRVPDLRRSIHAGRIKVVGAVYDMHNGKVNFLP